MITMGVDIGQSIDPTAVVVTETDRSRVHTVRWIETMPVGMSYPDVVDHLVTINERCRADGPSVVVVDYTGVGRPIVDLLRRHLRGGVRAVTISGAQAVSQPAPHETIVPKRDLIGAVEVVLQTRRLVIVDGLQGTQDLRAEVLAFQFEISTRGHDTYEAAAGHHDDLVTALSLALWHAEKSESWAFEEYMRRRGEERTNPQAAAERIIARTEQYVERAREREARNAVRRVPVHDHFYITQPDGDVRCNYCSALPPAVTP